MIFHDFQAKSFENEAKKSIFALEAVWHASYVFLRRKFAQEFKNASTAGKNVAKVLKTSKNMLFRTSISGNSHFFDMSAPAKGV